MTLLDFPNLTVDKNTLEADLCKRSFYDFFLRFWPVVDPEVLKRNWHIEFLCNELQEIAERVIKREAREYDLVINICPSSSKSIICTVMFPVWCWLNDPTLKFICASHSQELCNYQADRSRDILISDKYQELFPETRLATEGVEMMYTTKGGWRNGVSVGQKPVGKHAHFHIVDDLVDPNVAYSEAEMLNARKFLDQKLSGRMVDKGLTPLIMVMQRLAITDPAQHILDQPGRVIRHICIPAELGDGKNVRPRALRQFYKDGLFDPARLSRKELDKVKLQGEFTYASQYLQQPKPLGEGLFKVEKIEICDEPPKHFQNVFRYWDKAYTSEKAGQPGRGCYTVGVKMGRDLKGQIWIIDVVRGRWEPSQRENVIRRTAELDGKKVTIAIEEEPAAGKESAINTVKNLIGFSVRRDRPTGSTGDKSKRADPFATQVNVGNVKILEAPWNTAYLRELEFFPFSDFKDQVDASAGAFKMVTAGRHVGAL